MNEAQRILKLIESVDAYTPDGVLDEIDARVWCLMSGYRFQAMLDGGCLYDEGMEATENVHRLEPQFRYTKSRDALKAIEASNWRIEGVYYTAVGTVQVVYRRAPFLDTCVKAVSEPLPTWELAVAHAQVTIFDYEQRLAPEPAPPPPLTFEDVRELRRYGIDAG